ncbi:hypothetical protein ACFQX6_58120 [Streptosporangium lutulentum]
MIGAMLPVAFVGGPLVGGFLTDQLSWRWTFYVNVPVGAVALLIIGTGIRLRTERIRARIDYAGALLLTAAILALTLLASWGGNGYAWSSPQILALGAAASWHWRGSYTSNGAPRNPSSLPGCSTTATSPSPRSSASSSARSCSA